MTTKATRPSLGLGDDHHVGAEKTGAERRSRGEAPAPFSRPRPTPDAATRQPQGGGRPPGPQPAPRPCRRALVRQPCPDSSDHLPRCPWLSCTCGGLSHTHPRRPGGARPGATLCKVDWEPLAGVRPPPKTTTCSAQPDVSPEPGESTPRWGCPWRSAHGQPGGKGKARSQRTAAKMYAGAPSPQTPCLRVK